MAGYQPTARCCVDAVYEKVQKCSPSGPTKHLFKGKYERYREGFAWVINMPLVAGAKPREFLTEGTARGRHSGGLEDSPERGFRRDTLCSR